VDNSVIIQLLQRDQWHIILEVNVICTLTNATFWNTHLLKLPWPWNQG